MYWISVSALGALAFFYLKGKKGAQPEKEDRGSSGSAETVGSTAGAAETKAAAAEPEDKAAAASVPVDQAGENPEELKQRLSSEKDPYTRHLFYEQAVGEAYKERRKSDKMLSMTLSMGSDYVKEFEQLKEAVFEKMGNGPKQVVVFKQLAIALEEQKEFKKAIKVCETANSLGLDDGTKTGYEGRIARIKRKMNA